MTGTFQAPTCKKCGTRHYNFFDCTEVAQKREDRAQRVVYRSFQKEETGAYRHRPGSNVIERTYRTEET